MCSFLATLAYAPQSQVNYLNPYLLRVCKAIRMQAVRPIRRHYVNDDGSWWHKYCVRHTRTMNPNKYISLCKCLYLRDNRMLIRVVFCKLVSVLESKFLQLSRQFMSILNIPFGRVWPYEMSNSQLSKFALWYFEAHLCKMRNICGCATLTPIIIAKLFHGTSCCFIIRISSVFRFILYECFHVCVSTFYT